MADVYEDFAFAAEARENELRAMGDKELVDGIDLSASEDVPEIVVGICRYFRNHGHLSEKQREVLIHYLI